MPRWSNRDDSEDDDPGIVYDPEDLDWPEDEDEDPTVPCPYCHREILEEAERCPYCETLHLEGGCAGCPQAVVDRRRRHRVPLRRLSMERLVVNRNPARVAEPGPALEVIMLPTLVEQYRRWFEYEKDSHRKVLASLETGPGGRARLGALPEGAEHHGPHHRRAADLAASLRAVDVRTARGPLPDRCHARGSGGRARDHGAQLVGLLRAG